MRHRVEQESIDTVERTGKCSFCEGVVPVSFRRREGYWACQVSAKGEYAKDRGLIVQFLLESQAGLCLICDEGITPASAHLDHDHSCCPKNRFCPKCIRGVLCAGCNTGIGLLRESEDRMKRAIEYLRRSPRPLLDDPGAVPPTREYYRSLTAENVRDIRVRYAEGEATSDLAAEFKVKPGTIRAAVARRTWASVE